MSFARPLFLRVRSAISSVSPSSFGLSLVALVAVAGCGDPVAPPPQAAYFVSFLHPGVDCEIASHQMKLGDVSAMDRKAVVADGYGGADISCTVSGSGAFKVSDTTALDKGRSLTLDIPSISKNAKQATPARGFVAYASEKTVDTYTPDPMTPCNFFFADGSAEGVAAGKIWVQFDCPVVIAEASTCAMNGTALFENCATGTE